jgi:hypothetical protein
MVPAAVPVSAGVVRTVIRVGSAAEILLGVVAIAFPRPVSAALVALSYVLFTTVVAYARSRRSALATCGCFGSPDTPATGLHVLITAGLALVAGWVALAHPTGSIVSILARQPGHGIPLLVVSALCGWLVFVAMTLLARLEGVRRDAGIVFGPPA